MQNSEAYSEPRQTSKTELIPKIVTKKSFNLDTWQGPKHASNCSTWENVTKCLYRSSTQNNIAMLC